MSWKASEIADDTIHEIKTHPSFINYDSWTKNNNTYQADIGITQKDNSFTGSVYRLYKNGTKKKVGSIRIEPNGYITRFSNCPEGMKEKINSRIKGKKNNIGELQYVKVHYSNGKSIKTEMNKNLTDKEILNYFKIGKIFNIGTIKDEMAKVTKVEIHRKK